MTIKELIAQADELAPNAFGSKMKVGWIAELDGRIGANVMMMNIGDLQTLRYRHPEDMDAEPLVHFPHDGMYVSWLLCMIHQHNGEYEKFQNEMTQFNGRYSDFQLWFSTAYEPAQGHRREKLWNM